MARTQDLGYLTFRIQAWKQFPEGFIVTEHRRVTDQETSQIHWWKN